MRSISISKPAHEPVIDYRRDDAARDTLLRAVEGIPSGFEVPLVINGEEVLASEKIESVNPATGEIFCLAQKATPEHAQAAVQAALAARETWGKLPVEARVQKLRDLEWICGSGGTRRWLWPPWSAASHPTKSPEAGPR